MGIVRRKLGALLVVFLLLIIATGCEPIEWPVSYTLAQGEPNTAAETPASNSLAHTDMSDLEDFDAEERLLIEIYRTVNPSVVSIQVVRRAALHINTSGSKDPDDKFYEGGQGSGFFLDGTKGLVITNNHVIEGAEQVEVILSDGSVLSAQVLGADPDSDIAVVQVDLNGIALPSVTLGDSDALQVGQRVMAIGNPFGWQGTLTAGIVSGLGRTLALGHTSETVTGRFSIPEMIQTDAAINFGNSGGPLLDSKGRVIGMNTAMTSSVGVSGGVGFAIPINTVKRVVPDLIETGRYAYPWLGISGTDVRPVHVEAMDLPVDRGAIVVDVTPGGPAEKAGVRAASDVTVYYGEEVPIGGDVIIGIDGRQMLQFDDLLIYLLREKRPGDPVTLTVIREGSELDIQVELAERPQD